MKTADVRIEKFHHNIPDALKEYPRFVLWRYEDKYGKPTKVPYYRLNGKAQTNNPEHWHTFHVVMETFEKNTDFFSGIGFVIGSGITCIDLDSCIDAEGNITEKAKNIINALPGYVEISPSGKGVHIWLKAKLPPPDKKRAEKFGDVEIYDENSTRYVTLTGDVWEGRSAINEDDASDVLLKIYQQEQKEFEEQKEKERLAKQTEKERLKAEERELKQKIRMERQEEKRTIKGFDYNNDDELLQHIRESRQREKFTRLFDKGDISYYKSHSEAVASLLCSLAFWTRKNKERMDRLFRRSCLFDGKWDRPQNGSTWGMLEIEHACEIVKEVYDPQYARKRLLKFADVDDMGNPKATLKNLKALMDHRGISVYYDEINKTAPLVFEDGDQFSLDNEEEAGLGELMSLLEEYDMPTKHLDQYMCTLADKNRKNPVREWICGTPWDGTDHFRQLCTTIQTPAHFSSELKEIFLRKWLLSAVAAACHNPRQKKFSTRGVLVLQGKQSIGKTKWILRLAPSEWRHEVEVLEPSNKDSLMQALKFWIGELGELEGTLAKNLSILKSFLTKEEDQFRLPYAKKLSRFPRRTVFAASVNNPQFLIDKTGNDRFWVIPVESIDYEHNVNMQQVFAQLYEEWESGAKWWLTSAETVLLRKNNLYFQERDEIHDLLISRIDWSTYKQDIANGNVEEMTSTDILTIRFGIPLASVTKKDTNLVSAHLREITGQEAITKRVAGSVGRVWLIPKIKSKDRDNRISTERK